MELFSIRIQRTFQLVSTAMYRRGTYYRNLHQPVKRLHERGFCLPYFG